MSFSINNIDFEFYEGFKTKKPSLIEETLFTEFQEYTQKVRKAAKTCLKIAESDQKTVFLEKKSIKTLNNQKNLDDYFDYLDLQCYPNSFVGPLPLNGIREIEYDAAKKLVREVMNKQSNFAIIDSFDPFGNIDLSFRKAMLMDIIILLSRPRSRSLLFELANHEFPIFLKEQNYLKIGSEMYPGTGEVVMEKDAMISILVQSPNGDYYYSLQPRFCILAHELTHIYHEMLYGQEAIEDFKKYGRCKKEYTNPVEQYTITGEKNEKFPEELINENNILQEYNFPPRRNHGGRFMDPVTSADKYFSIAKEADIFFLAAIYDGALKNLEYYFNNQGKLKVENFSLHRFKSNIYNENKVKTLVFLLSKGLDPHFADEDGYSLLHFAVESGDVDFCRKLVNLGVDYNSLAKKNQNSPLHFAIVHNQIDCTKFLLSLEKINVNACNAQQQTPLHLALKMKNAEACNLLLKAKARTDIRDEEEKTAPELAYILNDNECLKYFKSYSCTIL